MRYDASDIPARYDSARGFSPDAMARWLAAIGRHVPAERIADIVDLGCGTGRFSHALADFFAARVHGVEPSRKMLEQARAKPAADGVAFHEGSGEAIPLGDASTDLVFISMVYHHLPDPALTARECRRVLRPGGHVCIRNTVAEVADDFPYVAYLPAARSVAASRLPARQAILATYAEAGFRTATAEVLQHALAPDWDSYVDKFSLKADSFVAGIPDPEFAAGIAAMRARPAVPPGQPVLLGIDLFIFRLP